MRLEKWIILGDGLVTRTVVVPSVNPLSAEEVLKCIRTEHAVITIFDALTEEFIGMAYAGEGRTLLEEVRYDKY